MKESRIRSLLKGLSWRIIATITIVFIAYFKTGDITLAFEIGAIEFVLKYLLYYFHERLWQYVPKGNDQKVVGFKSRDKISNELKITK